MTPKALRAIRLALGLSIEDFARILRLAPDELKQMESGERVINMARLSRAFERLVPETQDRD